MKRSKTSLSGILLGLGITILISLLLTWLQTSLTLKGKISIENANVITFFIRMISVLVGSLIATIITKERHLPVIGIITGTYLAVLISCGILFYEGTFKNLSMGVLSVLLGGFTTVLIKLKPQKRRKYTTKSIR